MFVPGKAFLKPINFFSLWAQSMAKIVYLFSFRISVAIRLSNWLASNWYFTLRTTQPGRNSSVCIFSSQIVCIYCCEFFKTFLVNIPLKIKSLAKRCLFNEKLKKGTLFEWKVMNWKFVLSDLFCLRWTRCRVTDDTQVFMRHVCQVL